METPWQHTRIVKEERVVRLRILHKPVHGTQNILLCGLTDWTLLVVRQDDHVFPLVPKVLNQVGRHVAHVIDAPSELATLAKVIDADQKRLAATCAVRILE